VASDVKVTLTADDQATEIVRRLSTAVKQLETQSKSSAGNVAKANAEATSSFSDMAKAIQGVIVAIGAIRIIEFVADTIKAADAIGKLAEKTGITTEALSVLGFAAKNADVDMEGLANGLKFLSRSTAELQAGSGAMATAFAALGLSASELKGLSLDQVLLKIADAQAKFADGSGKAAVLLKIFGRNGTEIIPLLNEIAEGGFDKARAQAEALGVVLSSKTTKAADDLDDSVKALTASLHGLVLSLTPIIGAFTTLINLVTKFVTGIRTGLADASGALQQFADQTGGAVGAVITLFATVARLAKGQQSANAPATDVGITANKIKPDVPFVDPAVFKALQDARLAAIKQQAKDEAEASQQGLKLQEQQQTAFFAQGLTTLSQFFAARADIVRKGTDASVAELEKEKKALQATPLPEDTDAERIKRATELAAINDQIARTKVAGEAEFLRLLEEERVATIGLGQALQGFALEAATATGNQIGAAQIQISEIVRRYELALKQIDGLSADSITELRTTLSTILTDRAAFDEKARQGDRSLTALGIERDAINARATQGLTSQRQATLDIAAAERARIPELTKIADEMQAFADELGNPELQQAADKFRASFANIGKVVDESTVKIANLRDTLLGAVQSDLSNFLGSTIDQVSSLADAFRQLALSIVQSFQRVLGDILATQAVEQIRKLFETSVTVSPQVAAAAATDHAAVSLGVAGATVLAGSQDLMGSATELAGSGFVLIDAATQLSIAAGELAAAGAASATTSLLGFASGGPVRGPGTGTSDSILARLSAGEFVMRADAVRRLGISFLSALNTGGRMPTLKRPVIGGLPAFATGGLVTSGDSVSASVSGGVDITVVADEGSILRAVTTRGGVRALRQVMSQNPNLFKAALEIG
jgi:hypothetical protein